ncbi:MAG: hypothetical protein ACOYXA_11250 [Bacteroidota bacterium]
MAKIPIETWILLAKFISGNATMREAQETKVLVENNSELKVIFPMLLATFKKSEPSKKIDTVKAFACVNHLINDPGH